MGLSYPNGFKIGSRALFTRHFSLEASIGTLLSGFTLSGGINYHANILHETKNPSWSLLFTYVREVSGVNRWYVLTGDIGLLQLQKNALHLYARGGASLWFKKPGYVGGAVRVVPLPSIDIGMGWGFP